MKRVPPSCCKRRMVLKAVVAGYFHFQCSVCKLVEVVYSTDLKEPIVEVNNEE
jgi:predicted  nucleic acid-binding Zn ribbon protein